MIKVQHLSKKFRSHLAVNDISFEVRRGEVFALLGPNGSGKTTTMKAIVGLNVPTTGSIHINELDISEYPTQTRRLMSYLPQRVIFPEQLTAREVTQFYASLRGLGTRAVDEALERARCNGFSDRPVGEFSGGMIQRLGLAVVAMPNSPVLLLDEPTASLDPQGVKRFREFILEQKEQQKTILFSTHLLHEAEQLADRVGIFLGGRLVAQESIENLRRIYSASGGTLEDMYLHFVGNEHHEP